MQNAVQQQRIPAASTNAMHEAYTGTPLNDENAKALYFGLSETQPRRAVLDAARRYLDGALQDTGPCVSDLPADPAGLDAWIDDNTALVGAQYETYLAHRKAGGERRYFHSKAHALYFLKSVAPTKTVDGAWLYGVLHHFDDCRFGSLIRIYLEELGTGLADKNHVVLYKKLLAAHGCERWDNLEDNRYVQGTIQLALAHHAQHFLPELIGFNLGYEQLPLHLLICAYELNELGIDPYYFTLHVTVDNAATGHAKTALNGLREAWPVVGDTARFYARVMNGYKLNMLGASTSSVIADFDLAQEVIAILREKSAFGKKVHSDYCRVGGRTVNNWLRDPVQIPDFLQQLQESGWIKRNVDPQQSRFWQLLEGERAEMFGVFSTYELQVIHDWIAGDSIGAGTAPGKPGAKRQLGFKARTRLQAALGQRVNKLAAPALVHSESLGHDAYDDQYSDFDHELRGFERRLQQTANREETMRLLADMMSPALHHTPVGLHATRLFARMFR